LTRLGDDWSGCQTRSSSDAGLLILQRLWKVPDNPTRLEKGCSSGGELLANRRDSESTSHRLQRINFRWVVNCARCCRETIYTLLAFWADCCDRMDYKQGTAFRLRRNCMRSRHQMLRPRVYQDGPRKPRGHRHRYYNA